MTFHRQRHSTRLLHLDPENLAVIVDDVEIAGLIDAEAGDVADRAGLGVKSALRRMNWLLGSVAPRLIRLIGNDQMLPLTKSAKKYWPRSASTGPR